VTAWAGQGGWHASPRRRGPADGSPGWQERSARLHLLAGGKMAGQRVCTDLRTFHGYGRPGRSVFLGTRLCL